MKHILITICLSVFLSVEIKAQVESQEEDFFSESDKEYSISDFEFNNYCSEFIRMIDTKYNVCTQESKNEGKQADQRITTIISVISSIKEYNIDIKAIDTSGYYLFGCPDGTVRVSTGLMDILSNDELLAVIGLQIKHATCKDAYLAFKKALYNLQLTDRVPKDGYIYTLPLEVLDELETLFLASKFSLETESSADDFGCNILKERSYDPKAMISALKKINEQTQKKLYFPIQDIELRIKRLESIYGQKL